MKKYSFLIIIIILCLSCKSGLYTVAPDYLEESYSKYQIDYSPKVLSYDINGFHIYVYNICERTDSEIDKNDRFCNCPEDFFNKSKNPEIKKVEEVYILKHQHSDLVLYFTTFSHKYIGEKKGFLNDPSHYQNKIVLDQIEYIYIGRFNKDANWIHFPSAKNTEDIILHFDPDYFPGELAFIKANVSTSENRYNNYEPIVLNGVFKDELVYKLSPSYSIDFYKNNRRIGDLKVPVKNIKTINIISRKGKTEIVFSPEDPNQRLYKMASKRIRYKPNFSIIEH